MSFKTKLIAVALLCVTAFSLCSCAVKVDPPTMLSSEDEAKIMSFKKVEGYPDSIEVGTYSNLSVEISASYEDEVKWVSSNTDVAVVDSKGRVDGIAPGKVTISACVKNAQIGYDIEVKKAGRNTLSFSNAFVDNEAKEEFNAKNYPEINRYAIIINKDNCCVTVFTFGSSRTYNVPVRSMVCALPEDIKEDNLEITERKKWEESDGYYYQYNTWAGDKLVISSAEYTDDAANKLVSDSFNSIGRKGDFKGVILSSADAQWIYDNCKSGTVVKIVNSENYDMFSPLGVPKPIKLTEDSKSLNWDPTDSHVTNPYVHKIKGVKDITVEIGGSIDFKSEVEVVDGLGNDATDNLFIDGIVDVNREGKYIVSYYAKNAVGRVDRKDATITVVNK